jgi:hypothetical protein
MLPFYLPLVGTNDVDISPACPLVGLLVTPVIQRLLRQVVSEFVELLSIPLVELLSNRSPFTAYI